MSGDAVTIRNVLFVYGLRNEVFTFLPNKDLNAFGLTSKQCYKVVQAMWKARAQENHCPEMPPGFPYKRFVCQIVPRMFGKAFHETYIGRLPDGVPSIPVNHIAIAFKPDPFTSTYQVYQTHAWVYVPGQQEVTHSAGILLEIDTGGNLVASLSGTKKVVAQTTLNNMGFIIAKCLKQGHPTDFYEHSWLEVLHQHGKTLISGGWYLLRRDVVEADKSYVDQKTAVEGRKLEVTSLFARGCIECYHFMRFGESFDSANRVVRTSTATFYGAMRSCQTGLKWETPAELLSRPRLYFELPRQESYGGVAVGIPAESSEATST